MENNLRLQQAIEVLKSSSLNISEEDYFALDAMSHSAIASYWKNQKMCTVNGRSQYVGDFDNFMAFISGKIDLSKVEGVIIGSLVDSLITHTDYTKRYYISDCAVPSAGVGKTLADEYIQNVKNGLFDISDDSMRVFLSGKKEYYANKSVESRTKSFSDSYFQYINESVEAGDRTVISKELFDTAQNIYDRLVESAYFNKIVNDDCIFQSKYLYVLDNIQYKIMPDLITILDGKIKLVDLKYTSSSLVDFADTAKNFQYTTQSSLYWNVIHSILADYGLEDLLDDSFYFLAYNRNGEFLVWEDETPSKETSRYDCRCAKRFKDSIEELEFYRTEKPKYPQYINEYKPNKFIA